MAIVFPLRDLSPDLRAAMLDGARNGTTTFVGKLSVRIVLPSLQEQLPSYLAFHHCGADLCVSGSMSKADVIDEFERSIGAGELFESAPDLAQVVLALFAWDDLFRVLTLFDGNVYIGAQSSLDNLMQIAAAPIAYETAKLLAELQALELIYQFPIARKFRGHYDGTTQFRLNGWGRSLASLLLRSHEGKKVYSSANANLKLHLERHFERYCAHLQQLPTLLDESSERAWWSAKRLPVAVLT